MSLYSGDLTTPQRAATWMAGAPSTTSPILLQLISSQSRMIYNHLNRAPTFSQVFNRVIDGVGNYQLVLPDYPVTSIASITDGSRTIQPASPHFGFRFIPWQGILPGEPSVIEFNGGYFRFGAQNVKVTYTAGYLIQNEPNVVSATAPYIVTTIQPQGIWCRDAGVTYAATGIALTPVTTLTAAGQYIIPTDANPGVYTFNAADAGAQVLISYSFIPADLEEATIQMVAERYAYRGRIGEIMKSLGGQETIRYQRGAMGPPWSYENSLPPEVNDLISPYVSVLPPVIGAPL